MHSLFVTNYHYRIYYAEKWRSEFKAWVFACFAYESSQDWVLLTFFHVVDYDDDGGDDDVVDDAGGADAGGAGAADGVGDGDGGDDDVGDDDGGAGAGDGDGDGDSDSMMIMYNDYHMLHFALEVGRC